ncbi:MAG: T9SS type A sorting domain-containing protein [Bacteroidota bacterium]
MKKLTLLFYFSVMSIGFVNAQFTWNRIWDYRYGGTSGDYQATFEKTRDGGYLLSGRTSSDSSGNKYSHMFGNGAFDYWVVKVNSAGIMQWEKSIRASGNDMLWCMDVTSDGGYILGGTSDSPFGGDKMHASRGGTDYWIVKLDSLGNVLWDQVYGGSGDEDFKFIMETADGGFLVGGDSRSNVSGDKTEPKFGINDYWVVKTDAQGVKQWDKVYGGPGYEQYRVSVQTADHGFIHGGASSSGVGGNKTDPTMGGIDYWLVRTDSMGVILWDNSYGGNADDNFHNMILTPGENMLIGGWSLTDVSGDKTQPTNGQYDLWVLKLNSAGTILWDKDYGGTGIEDEFNHFYETADHGFLIAAVSYSNTGADKSDDNLGVEQNWVLKIDSFGNRQWDKTIFSLGHNEGLQIKQTLDPKCYVVFTGDNGLIGGDKTQDAWGGFSNDFWIIKYCQGEINNVSDLNFTDEELLVYPNPFINEIKVKLNASAHKGVAIADLYDILGHKILSRTINGDLTIDTSELPKGIYILEVSADNKSSVKKIVK